MIGSLFEKPRPSSPERMMLVVDRKGRNSLLVARGYFIQTDVDEALLSMEDIGLDEVLEQPGIWVFDCTPKLIGYEDVEVDYDKESSHRAPTEEEWELLKKNDLAGLFDLWKDIKSLEEEQKVGHADKHGG